MATRDERKVAAAKNIALMRGAFAAETAATVASATVYEAGDAASLELPEPTAEATTTEATSDFATRAIARAEGKVVVVDPISFTRPGGAYEDGSFGPEQILCSESNLYPVLCDLKAVYHDQNRGYASGQLFTSRALYLEGVVFKSDGAMRTADVLGIPEPNRTRALENHRSERECDTCLTERIDSLLRIAAARGCETLIVGAFGCAPQGFPAEQVIAEFQSWFAAHPGAIEHVVFAVPRVSFAAFDAAFNAPKEEAPAPIAAQAEGEPTENEEDFDYRTIDLPEGITLR